ncbi:MAG: hypothetical protein AB1Z55_08220 [Acidimicrobiia bacterium]
MTSARGSAPVELALGVGVLLVPVVLLLAALPPLVEYRSTARLAAAEAARLVATGDGSPATEATARAAAKAIAGDLDAVVTFCGGTCPVVRGAIVEVEVTVGAPAVVVPLVGEIGAVRISASHRERVDDYRSLP